MPRDRPSRISGNVTIGGDASLAVNAAQSAVRCPKPKCAVAVFVNSIDGAFAQALRAASSLPYQPEAIKPRIPDSAIRAGRTLVGTAASAVGITLASAAISAARQRKEDQ